MELLRFLFNFGDNYYQGTNESIWIRVIPIFLSSLLSFIIAFIMFRHQTKTKERDESKRLSGLKDYIFYCLDRLIILLNLQIVSLETLIVTLKNDIEKGYALNKNSDITVGLNLHQIEALNVDDTFKILVTDVKRDRQNIINYQFLIGSGENLEKIVDNLYLINSMGSDLYENNKKLILNYHHEFNEIIKDIDEQLEIIIYEQDPLMHDYMINIRKIWFDYIDKKTQNVEDIITLLTNPVMVYCASYIVDESRYEIKQTRKMMTICQNVNIAYAELIQIKTDQIDVASASLKNLQDIKRVYEDILTNVFK